MCPLNSIHVSDTAHFGAVQARARHLKITVAFCGHRQLTVELASDALHLPVPLHVEGVCHNVPDSADEELSFSEIQERLHVPEEDVTRLTHSLSCAKYKILNKSPASKTVSKTDVFSMNKKFADRMRRIRVSSSVCMSALLALSSPFLIVLLHCITFAVVCSRHLCHMCSSIGK